MAIPDFARRIRGRSSIALVAVVTVGGLLSVVPASAAGAASAARAGAASGTTVPPNKIGELDCNGLSPIQRSVRPAIACSDPRGNSATDGRFFENGKYIGHDEPDLRFLSTKPGSGENVTWTERLGLDPAAAPTVTNPGGDVTHYVELTIAPWFSMALCNPQSYPENPCKPRSDANAPAESCIVVSSTPCTQANAGGGSSFLEVQFYPPGEAPFPDNISCDNSHWCASLHINDLECTLGFVTCNPNCVEPTNFAFIQTNGVPTGPPSPQLSDAATFTPNANTLLMNPGDAIRVHIFDAGLSGGGSALEVAISDVTTGQTGFMLASAANGFMSTDLNTCNGTPFNYEPEYSTARVDNIVPWAALQVDISTQFEIGHFEPCSTVTGPATLSIGSFTDTFWKHCVGAYETTTAPDGGKNPEISDALCYPQGDTHGGLAPPNVVTGCAQDFTQNGDLDFDGTPYWPDWPDSTTPDNFPSPFLEHAPTTVGGANYPQLQFQTDAALSESTCTGPSGCAVPPPNAPGKFYPYWTSPSACTWEFGNMTNGNTFGQAGEYGTNQFATLGYPEIESGLISNTCT
jgi:hypothetical protein